MNLFDLMRNAMIFMLALLIAAPGTQAQTIPYGISNKAHLDTILQDAKAHLASHERDVNWLKVAGIASHQLASLQVKGASDDAVNYLKIISELEPENSEILAYLGSAYAMAGRDSSFVVNKVSNVNKGLAALDKAVKKAPHDLNVRFIRASVAYSLPETFSRKTTAESDYLFYVNEAESGKTIDPQRLAEAYFKLGKIAEEKGQKAQALNFYMQAQKAAPQSDWAQQASKAMQ